MQRISSKPKPPTTFLKVPHIKQSSETSCGAAALSMVYKYYELDNQTEDAIWTRLKRTRNLSPDQEIIYANDLYNDIKNNDLHNIKGQAVWEEPDKIFALLKEFLRIKAPLIACQRWRKNKLFGHYKIVIGLDEGFVIVNDPELEVNETKIPKDQFVLDWQKYSDEAPGGLFIAALNEKQAKEIRKLPLMNFLADIKYFEASNLKFLL